MSREFFGHQNSHLLSLFVNKSKKFTQRFCNLPGYILSRREFCTVVMLGLGFRVVLGVMGFKMMG